MLSSLSIRAIKFLLFMMVEGISTHSSNYDLFPLVHAHPKYALPSRFGTCRIFFWMVVFPHIVVTTTFISLSRASQICPSLSIRDISHVFYVGISAHSSNYDLFPLLFCASQIWPSLSIPGISDICWMMVFPHIVVPTTFFSLPRTSHIWPSLSIRNIFNIFWMMVFPHIVVTTTFSSLPRASQIWPSLSIRNISDIFWMMVFPHIVVRTTFFSLPRVSQIWPSLSIRGLSHLFDGNIYYYNDEWHAAACHTPTKSMLTILNTLQYICGTCE
jgi:hypothetical protein